MGFFFFLSLQSLSFSYATTVFLKHKTVVLPILDFFKGILRLVCSRPGVSGGCPWLFLIWPSLTSCSDFSPSFPSIGARVILSDPRFLRLDASSLIQGLVQTLCLTWLTSIHSWPKHHIFQDFSDLPCRIRAVREQWGGLP